MSGVNIRVPFADVNRARQLVSAAYLNEQKTREEIDRLVALLQPGKDLRPDLVVDRLIKLRQQLERDWRVLTGPAIVPLTRKGKGVRQPQTAA